MASLEQDSRAKSFLAPPDKSSIYVYRTESFGGAIPITVALNGKVAGQTGPQTFFLWEVDPGPYEVSAIAENTSAITLDAEAGKVYFIWQEVKMGLWMARSQLQRVDDETGRKGVTECKRAQSNFWRVRDEGVPGARRACSNAGGATMVLKLGAQGDAVKALQRGLNKIGSLLIVDGDFGSGTEAAVVDACAALRRPGPPQADDGLLAALATLPEPSRDLTAPGVTFIGREEVSSPGEYRRRYKHPVWPTPNSGITIGIGYDLRFATEATLRADWSDVLPRETIATLVPVLGKPGSSEALAAVASLDIPLPAAMAVFLKRMVPAHAGNTRTAYPTLDTLPPARRTALVSLVFNRGNDLAGDRRREMRRIRELLDAGNPEPVAAEIEAMARLWDPVKERGVIDRRRREATLWRDGFGALQLV
jgi:hypothetical protein